MTGRIFSINTSHGGVPKLAVPDAFVSAYGLFGDSQGNRKIHGGPDRAVCLFSIERIRGLENEGHPISAGSTGENITVSGIDWDLVKPGVVIEAGEALLEVTSYTTPCRTIQGCFADGIFMRMSHKLYPGWSRVYARVLKDGTVRIGDRVSLKSEENYGPSFE